MKFLCDKCKTRYSIGDDRVRGKILKIRCKNCANVITVREGMDISPNEPRRTPTMAIQTVQVAESTSQPHAQPQTTAAPHGALGAAFASQLSKPPPALEEEWYVSVDGNQEGPFSLTAAQRWVATKPFEAELHCWSEGFDDWLPVDKVSHFRNLRKRPEPRKATIPPPIPKTPTVRGDEPKPLFAATMASIERTAGVAPEPAKAAKPRAPIQPLATKTKANGTGVSNALRDSGEGVTQIDRPAFASEDAATIAEPLAGKRVEAKVPTLAPAPSAPKAAAPSAPQAAAPDLDDEDDNLNIGEVSRVVNLSDLAAMEPRKGSSQSNPAIRTAATQSNPALRATASSPALRNSSGNLSPMRSGLTGSLAKLSPSELGMNVDPALAAAGPTPDESLVARSFAQRHRRGMLMLIGVSGLLVLGVVAAVAFFFADDDRDLPIGLGGTRVIDTSRPEDIVRRQLPPPPNQTGGTTTTQRPRITTRPQTTVQPELPDEPMGPNSRLDAGEVEAMAAKYGEGTKRCYMRAQKGALGFEIAETKKIDVTLTVAKDGTVSEVQLSKHANNEFGQCLIARIKGWKFRESRGGTFRIALAFSAS